MNLGARFSKHRLLWTPPSLPARSCVQEEQWDTSVPARAKVRAGDGSWQCCPAWQGSSSPDLSGFENRMGTRHTFVFSWERERDLQAVPGMLQPPGCCGGGDRALAPWAASFLHPSHFVFRQQIPKLSPSSPAARLAGEAPLGAPAGMSSSHSAFGWKPPWLSPRLTCWGAQGGQGVCGAAP